MDEQKKVVDPGATMQIDAYVEDMEEFPAHEMSRPPPLPPKKPGKAAWVLGVVVVLVMAGLGAGIGLFFFGIIGGAPEPAPAASIPPPPPPRPEPAQPAQPAPSNVVQMDEIVFDETEPAAP